MCTNRQGAYRYPPATAPIFKLLRKSLARYGEGFFTPCGQCKGPTRKEELYLFTLPSKGVNLIHPKTRDFMLSKKAKYALKALLYLTKQQDKGLVIISDIAENERIPRKFLEAILVDLKTSGVLQSVRGKNGGYYLSKNPSEISVGNVIRMIDGPLAAIPCVSHLYYRKCDECIDEATCEIRIVMKKVRDATADILDNTFLSDLETISGLVEAESKY